MKIKRLWISRYKNIEDVTLEFNQDQLITLLIGQNGLGKSNLIEILALIFRDLNLLDQEDDFQSWPYDYFEYEIDYECRSSEVRVHCREGDFSVWTKPLNTEEELAEIRFSEFRRRKFNELLPKYIIGYYSGENKRVKDIIRIFEEEYWNSFKQEARRRRTEEQERGFRSLFFAENLHSQMILLTLALYKNARDLQEDTEWLFKDFLGIEGITDFNIKFNNPDWTFSNIGGVNKSINYIISNIQEGVQFPFWNLTGKADLILTRFYNHQIERRQPTYYEDTEEDERSYVNEFLEFDDIDFPSFFEEISDYFPKAIDFFDAIEATSFLDVLKQITIEVKKSGVEDPIEFVQLSEGEQQLLSVLGLILITGGDDCLFLLDEPDTHLNPQWQRDYIQLLKKFNLDDQNSQIFVATHSPLLVQSIEDADTVLFKKKDGKVIIDQTDFKEEGWRIDHVLASDLFGLSSTRPPKYDDFYEVRNTIIDKGELTEEDRSRLTEYENMFGAFPTGETINEIKTMALLSRVAKKIEEQENQEEDD